MSETPSDQFLEGVSLFNAEEFFACHDVLEEIWSETLGPERDFYQGLIQAAVALFHFTEGNLGGARKMYASSRRYLAPYPVVYYGIDLATFLADYERCFAELMQASGDYPAGLTANPDLIPRLRLTGEGERGM